MQLTTGARLCLTAKDGGAGVPAAGAPWIGVNGPTLKAILRDQFGLDMDVAEDREEAMTHMLWSEAKRQAVSVLREAMAWLTEDIKARSSDAGTGPASASASAQRVEPNKFPSRAISKTIADQMNAGGRKP